MDIILINLYNFYIGNTITIDYRLCIDYRLGLGVDCVYRI